MLNFVRKNVKIDYFVKDLQNFVQEAKIEPNSSWEPNKNLRSQTNFQKAKFEEFGSKKAKVATLMAIQRENRPASQIYK